MSLLVLCNVLDTLRLIDFKKALKAGVADVIHQAGAVVRPDPAVFPSMAFDKSPRVRKWPPLLGSKRREVLEPF